MRTSEDREYAFEVFKKLRSAAGKVVKNVKDSLTPKAALLKRKTEGRAAYKANRRKGEITSGWGANDAKSRWETRKIQNQGRKIAADNSKRVKAFDRNVERKSSLRKDIVTDKWKARAQNRSNSSAKPPVPPLR